MINSSNPSGFLCINKPSGITSFDVIRELRRYLKIRKLGHSGVLDKPATGVLVVGANKATKLFELFSDFEKDYTADIYFGLTTTTDDLTGELSHALDGPATPNEDDVVETLETYRGTIDQIPPAFSLTKIGGKELYRYALAGEEVEVKPKRVTIVASHLEDFENGIDPSGVVDPESKLAPSVAGLKPLTRATVHLTCVGGVYVRSVARDVGADLGTGGALGRLIRTRVGPFRLEDAYTLEDVAEHVGRGNNVGDLFKPMAAIAPENTSLNLDSTQLNMVRNGRSVRRFKHHLPAAVEKQGDLVYGLDPGNDLAVILEVAGVNQHGLVELKPVKVLN